jgi:hypothetical protein
MAYTLAELQSTLEVYKGLFEKKEDAEIILIKGTSKNPPQKLISTDPIK